MKISELAQAGRCTTDTVRFYEKAGLLPPAGRTSGNYRNYTSMHLARLRFVRNCRSLDMTHDEIRGLLVLLDAPEAGCGAANMLIDQHIAHVEARLSSLNELKRQLDALRLQCGAESTAESCGILQRLTQMEAQTSTDRPVHG